MQNRHRLKAWPQLFSAETHALRNKRCRAPIAIFCLVTSGTSHTRKNANAFFTPGVLAAVFDRPRVVLQVKCPSNPLFPPLLL
jgi:hypothetical protein